MAKDPAVERALRDGFRARVLPVVAPLGFVEPKKRPKRYASVVAAAVRPLEDDARLELRVWCEHDRASDLHVRLDRVALRDGVELYDEIDLPFAGTTLARCAREMRGRESLERMAFTLAFVGDALAEALAAAGVADAQPARAADVQRAHEAWRMRHARGPIDETWVEAKLVFVGEDLVSVDCAGERVHFKIAQHGIDASTPLACGGWWTNAAGVRRPCRLRAGTRTWHLDLEGNVVRVEDR